MKICNDKDMCNTECTSPTKPDSAERLAMSALSLVAFFLTTLLTIKT